LKALVESYDARPGAPVRAGEVVYGIPAELAHRIIRGRTQAAETERAAVVAWLREDAQKCDCAAREESECACGAWGGEVGERTYKRVYIEDIADAIEARAHLD
jgi:hypothetical protein